MTHMILYVGNKNYSSWSLRPWLVLAESGLAFEDVVIPLDESGTRAEILRRSPSGRVPCLDHDGLVVWDSLAIAEYLAELCPKAGLWPADRAARAVARSLVAEMHAGFVELRARMPMNIRSSFPDRPIMPEVQSDIDRITAIWRERRRISEWEGPFLFGHFTIADAFFAPVVSRFRTYAVPLDPICQAYADAIWALPSFARWQKSAADEPMMIESAEF